MVSPLATVGILSIGEMGLGIAKLLRAYNYKVVTNISDRSEATHTRARSASLDLVPNDTDLTLQADFILSIVPPRDALSTAQRIVTAAQKINRERTSPLYYIDLNAISPRSATEIADLFKPVPSIRFIDGGIIGPAPKLKPDTDHQWTKPSLVVSGEHELRDAGTSGSHLQEVLNVKHIALTIGPASGLKMCFASTTKGFTAIAIQSFTTAHRLGVLDELKGHLKEYSPKTRELAEKGLVSMPPKAYRWIREMEEIADTLHEEGGFARDMFQGVSDVYRVVADDSELGKERTENRVRGKTAEDVARAMSEGIDRKKVKTE
ncbi:MAG: hypothetical protein M1827_000999 [Pycnora praestabilis]|nr:MAG: hypothetical protein M1827_000999 [Pycnora praestabilis]